MKKRILSIVLAVLMLVSVMPISAIAADAEAPESNITAVKSAQWVKGREGEGIAKVTIQVSGKAPEEWTVTDPTDIVLVIDRSESMDHKATNLDKGTKMAQAKAAAKQFAKKMLESDKVQIAVVTYTKTAQAIPSSTAIPFSGNYDTVEERINSIKPDNGQNNNSGTNVQAGIHAARDLLTTSTATNKIMIVLSDGQPNYSFRFTGTADYIGCNQRSCGEWFLFYGTVYPSGGRLANIKVEADYLDFIGSGQSFNLGNGNATLKIKCVNHNWSYEDYGVYNGVTYNGDNTRTDHSVATIWEAGQAKNEGVEIYSIGFGIGGNDNATKTMQGVATTVKDHYFSAGVSANDIEEVFNSIAKQVSKYVAYNPIVIDTISNDFEYCTDSTLTASAGERDKVEVSQDGKTVTWDLAAEQLDTTEHTLTFYVKYKNLDNPAAPSTNLPTNDGAQLKYAKEENGQATETQNIANASVLSLSKTVSYKVTGTAPKGYMKPGDAHVWVGHEYTVADVPETVNAEEGTYTFEGWKANGKTVSGKLPITADITLTGEWKFEAAPTTKTITVTKVWDKDVTDAQKQPVVITLYQRVGMGTVNPETDYYDSITLDGTETAPWTGVFKDLPLKNDKDEKYGYAVVETRIGTLQVTNGSANVIRMNEDGESAYTVGTWFVNSSRTPAEPNTYYITNTYTSKPQYTLDYQFVGTNKPDDVTSAPDAVTGLYAGQRITLADPTTEETGWTFDGWYEKQEDIGNAEKKLSGLYEVTKDATLYGEWTYQAPQPETINITVTKEWDNVADALKQEVTVQLFDGEEPVKNDEKDYILVLNAGNSWSGRFENLPADGDYNVKETHIGSDPENGWFDENDKAKLNGGTWKAT